MTDSCGRFHFVKDMNGDGVFSISDVWLVIEVIWLLPAKVAVSVAQMSPALTTFLEINCSTGESWGGGIFSLITWYLVLLGMLHGD